MCYLYNPSGRHLLYSGILEFWICWMQDILCGGERQQASLRYFAYFDVD